ncbi:MAG: hypothetical protein COB65_10990 [Thalassobium sp.]|nr:MAG: hypothetical protein COB65_10990 [Thalassobium sp.]
MDNIRLLFLISLWILTGCNSFPEEDWDTPELTGDQQQDAATEALMPLMEEATANAEEEIVEDTDDWIHVEGNTVIYNDDNLEFSHDDDREDLVPVYRIESTDPGLTFTNHYMWDINNDSFEDVAILFSMPMLQSSNGMYTILRQKN